MKFLRESEPNSWSGITLLSNLLFRKLPEIITSKSLQIYSYQVGPYLSQNIYKNSSITDNGWSSMDLCGNSILSFCEICKKKKKYCLQSSVKASNSVWISDYFKAPRCPLQTVLDFQKLLDITLSWSPLFTYILYVDHGNIINLMLSAFRMIYAWMHKFHLNRTINLLFKTINLFHFSL